MDLVLKTYDLNTFAAGTGGRFERLLLLWAWRVDESDFLNCLNQLEVIVRLHRGVADCLCSWPASIIVCGCASLTENSQIRLRSFTCLAILSWNFWAGRICWILLDNLNFVAEMIVDIWTLPCCTDYLNTFLDFRCWKSSWVLTILRVSRSKSWRTMTVAHTSTSRRNALNKVINAHYFYLRSAIVLHFLTCCRSLRWLCRVI